MNQDIYYRRKVSIPFLFKFMIAESVLRLIEGMGITTSLQAHDFSVNAYISGLV